MTDYANFYVIQENIVSFLNYTFAYVVYLEHYLKKLPNWR